jgi:hypothetical protein
MTTVNLLDTRVGDRVLTIAAKNNLAAATDPLVTDDSSKGYEVGSTWVNVTGQRTWEAVSVAVGAAVWVPSSGGGAPLPIQPTPAAKTVSATLTGAEVLNGIITGNQGAGAGAALTMPLATAMETAVAAAYGAQSATVFGQSGKFSVINISAVAAEVITMTTNTGWTLVGDMTIACIAVGDTSSGLFEWVRNSATTYTLYRLS